MPTYEYECPDCGHRFDEFQMMSDKKLKKCPKCGKRKLRRLFGTGAGVIFKGSGFYETDYKKKTGGPSKEETASAKSASDAKSGSAKSDSSKSDTSKSDTSKSGTSSSAGKKPKKGTKKS